MKRADGRLLEKTQHSSNRRPVFWRCQYRGMTIKSSSGSRRSQKEPRRQAVCAAEGRTRKVTQAFMCGAQIIRHGVINTVGVRLCLVQIVVVPWLFLLEEVIQF